MSEKLNIRKEYGKLLANFGYRYPNLVVLDADLQASTYTKYFKEKFPDRYLNLGIAEADMISTAAGFALAGDMPYTHTFAVFVPGRTYDQIRQTIAIPNLNVKIVSTHGGIVGGDGKTHSTHEDINIMRALPNMTIYAPSVEDIEPVSEIIAEHKGPAYLRLFRHKAPKQFHIEDLENFRKELGKGYIINSGSDITLISNGYTLHYVFDAASDLESKGISVELIGMPCIKPLDKKLLLDSAEKTGKVVTAEDHNIIGGLGTAVAEVLAETYTEKPITLKRIGIPDKFVGSARDIEQLYEKYGLNQKGIIKTIENMLDEI